VTPQGVANGSSRSDANDGAPSAVLYLRVSTKEQAERDGDTEGYSIPAQREICKRKATALGAAVLEEFVDRGESARNADRPELQTLLAYIRSNPVDYVIVHKVDRLARNRADDVEITLAIRAAGAALVSCSENIDETPSGILLHGIMSSIAEFYSRNLASEVIKGSVQKAKAGGTLGKAPLGYLNVRRIENGREIRTVEIDPVRGPLLTWAFEAYATGEWSVQRLLDELTRRGLETTSTANRPARPLYLSHLHKLLRHPYYKGIVRYRGIEYQGRHTPLVTEEVWQRVQDILEAHRLAGDRPRIHNHYLKGSLYCANPDCRSRLIVTHARSRSGRIYPYFVCAGRHSKRTNCTFKAVLIDVVEENLIEHLADHQLSAETQDALGRILINEFDALRQEAATERARLIKRQRRLLAEREKLLHAHYADAVPLDLLRSEQQRIRDALVHIDQRLAATDYQHALLDANLNAALKIVTNLQATYITAPESVRRQLNQALFKRIEVDDKGDVTAELAEPFYTLLSPPARQLAASRTRQDIANQASEPYRQIWDDSLNDEGAHVSVSAFHSHHRSFRGGLNREALVAPGGVEPPHADSKSAALSAELRGPARRVDAIGDRDPRASTAP
jgi:site-specific DNA recombinase